MILASSIAAAGDPVRAVIGRGTCDKPHEVHLSTADTGMFIGGSEDDCVFPLDSTVPTVLRFDNVLLTDEIWVDGTGSVEIIESGLDKTPDL